MGGADLRVLLLVPVIGALIVALAPGRWSRAVGGAVAGLTLVVAALVAMADAEALVVRAAWVPALGLSLSLGLGALGVPGVLVTCLIGQVAAVAPGGSRGSIAGGLALQAVVLGGLLARDLGLLVGVYGLLAPLVAGLIVSGTSVTRARAGLVVGFYLSLGTALLGLAVGALAVAHHDASGGVWSLELDALGGLLLPARAEAAIAAGLGLAGALTLGLWPLHGWLMAGIAAARPGTAILLAGALRWLGIDLLLRVWLVVTPTAAATMGPAIGWIAVVGAVYGGLLARAEGRGASGLAGLVPAGLLVLGLVGQHHEGVLGALGLGLALCLGGAAGVLARGEVGSLRRVGALGMVPAPGLVGLVGAALVLIGTARFAGVTLAGSAMSLALVGLLALVLSLGGWRGLADGTGREGHVAGDRPFGAGLADGTGREGHVAGDRSLGGWLRVAVLLAPLVVLGVWPGPGLRRVEAAGGAAIDAMMRRRCERAAVSVAAPMLAPAQASEACAQPMRALEKQQRGPS